MADMAHVPQWKHSSAYQHPSYLTAPAEYPSTPAFFTNSYSMTGQRQQGNPEHGPEANAKTQPHPAQYTLKPPERNLQGDIARLEGQSNKAYAAVDSWRSYQNDPTTLSNQHTNASKYAPSPQAVEFTSTYPSVPATHRQSSFFTPYQPLRTSNGTYEKALQQQDDRRKETHRAVVAHASRDSYSAADPKAVLAAQSTLQHRYPVRSKQQGNDGDDSFRRSTHGAQDAAQHRCHTRSRDQDSVSGSTTPWTSDVPLLSIEGGSNYMGAAQASLRSFLNVEARRSTPRGTRERTEERTVSPPPAPEATEAYISQAKISPVQRSTPRKLLVILDLNGTLLARPQFRNPTEFITRPGVDFLLQYLFENHIVMIWTSMHMKNARPIVNQLLDKFQIGELAAFWARDKLELSQKQLHAKVQVYKKLDQVFADEKIHSAYPLDENGPGGWDQSNTILVDDSNLKALAQPHNLLQIPEFKAQAPKKTKARETWKRNQESILCSLILKLDELKYQTDVSRLILRWQTGKAEVPREPKNTEVIEEEEEKEQGRTGEPTQLLTPESLNSNDFAAELEHQPTKTKDVAKEGGEREPTRSESEIPESVWADLLAGK